MTLGEPGTFGMQSIQAMLGMSRGTVTRLVMAGFVTPRRGPRNEYRFSFQDVVLLRTAHRLKAAKVPTRRLLHSLRQLRATLPAEVPLSGLRIQAIGDSVAVREGGAHWEPVSGQLLMDFEVAGDAGAVRFIDVAAAGAHEAADAAAGHGTSPASADDWFCQAEALEASDPAAAMDAYRRSLALDPGLARAYVNLGALLCEHGQCRDALALYERAVELAPDEPEVHFNGAIALEDLGMHRDAISSYERCLALAPYLADAHYNAARLFERLGDRQGALRHFNAYRRLQAPPPFVAP